MPPRKSNASIASAEDGASGTPAKESGMGVEEYNLPRTMIQRLSKGMLPPNTQIQKDALLAISKSATVFVNYLTAHANESAQRANKKTIQPKDVMDAIAEIEFDSFLPRLEGELTKYNAVQCDKRNTYRRKIRDEQKAKEASDPTNPTNSSTQSHQPQTQPGGHPNSSAGAADNDHDHDDSTISANSQMDIHNGTNGRNGNDGGDEPASKKLKRANGDISDADDISGDEGMEAEGMEEGEGEGDDSEGDEEEEGDGFESAREDLLEEDRLEEGSRGELHVDDAMDEGEDSD